MKRGGLAEIGIDRIRALYSEHENVHLVGEMLGASGESIRQYMQKHSIELKNPRWTSEQIKILRAAYLTGSVDLFELSKLIGKSENSLASKAHKLGITSARGKQIRTDRHRASTSRVQKKRFEDPDERRKIGERASAAIKRNGHPRGFMGHKRTLEELAKMQEGGRRAWANPNSKFNSKKYREANASHLLTQRHQLPASKTFSRTQHGFRDDIKIYVRSSWEANYARYLNFLIKHEKKIERWEYEPDTFWFEKIKRGCRSYKPDFKVFLADGTIEYHEVKGWMYPRAKTALNRMRIYHPQVKIVLIDQVRYKGIARSMSGLIPGWESPRKKMKR